MRLKKTTPDSATGADDNSMTEASSPTVAYSRLIAKDWLAPDFRPEEFVEFWRKFGFNPTDFFSKEGIWYTSNDVADKLTLVTSETWSAEEAQAFVGLLEKVERHFTERGFRSCSSTVWKCRVCAKRHSHQTEYFWRGIKWHSGFKHYILEHRIQPSGIFQHVIKDLEIRIDSLTQVHLPDWTMLPLLEPATESHT